VMTQLAQELVPERIPVAVERVRAYRWIAVEPAVELALEAVFDGVDQVEVTIQGYASLAVRMGQAYPQAPEPKSLQLENPRPAPISAEQLYSHRWMFHGPAFQGVTALGPLGDNGISGTLQ